MKIFARLTLALLVLSFAYFAVSAQTTEFTYQGSLQNGGVAANGNFDLEFALYDALSGGTQIGTTLTQSNVVVTNGSFAVNLDFGVAFPGADRYLDIRVRTAGGGAFTPLTPRQKITSGPYSNRSLSATAADSLSGNCVLCITDAQIYGVSGSKVTGTVANASTAGNVTGIVAIANGGTGSATKNFVDLSTDQIVGGNKTFTGILSGNGSGLTNLPPNGFIWEVVTATTQQAASNKGYAVNNVGQVTVTLPASPNVGDIIRLVGIGGGGWKLVQAAGQSISGTFGSLPGTSWSPRDTNRDWQAVASSSDGAKMVAVVTGGQIYTSTDSGLTWTGRDTSRNWVSVASSTDGTKLAAVVSGGQIYTSADSGANWTARETNRFWNAVASSFDGTKLAAVVAGGQIYMSTDSGATWTPRDTNRSWYSVASSTSGIKLVAVVYGGQIYTSTDSGSNWTARNSNRNWQAVATSIDGVKLVAVVNGGQIYTSTDSGLNWTPRDSDRNWHGVASSADGAKLVAVVNGGQIYTSSDSGLTWNPRDGNRSWFGVATSADSSKLAAVVNGGQVYTSPGLWGNTTQGTTGYLTGGQGTGIELLYIGNGQFVVSSHEGSIFAF